MLQLLLTAAMMQTTAAAPMSQVQPCVWPHVCSTESVAQVQTCVWPHTCAETQAQQFQSCVWPHRCASI
jgi:hypothetical protein